MNVNHLPLITIAIPTYNRAGGYLRQAIECALGQTYYNIEVFVSDNCSTDNTEEVIKGFTDQRLRYFRHRENIGANNNFNYCLNQARGDYFLLFHDDDLIDKDFLEVCMSAAGYRRDAGIIRTGTRIIDENGKVLREKPNQVNGLNTEDFFRGWFSGRTELYLCSTLFNTNYLREAGGFSSIRNLFQDAVAEVLLAARYGRIDVYDVKASFRKHSGEATFAAKVGDWCDDSLYLLDVICSELPQDRVEAIQILRREGMRFFSRLNYNRAVSVRPILGRYTAFFTVIKKFHFRHSPSFRHLLSLVFGKRAYGDLLKLKRKWYPSVSETNG